MQCRPCVPAAWMPGSLSRSWHITERGSKPTYSSSCRCFISPYRAEWKRCVLALAEDFWGSTIRSHAQSILWVAYDMYPGHSISPKCSSSTAKPLWFTGPYMFKITSCARREDISTEAHQSHEDLVYQQHQQMSMDWRLLLNSGLHACLQQMCAFQLTQA